MENIAEINNNFANRWNISLDNDRFFNSCIEVIGKIFENKYDNYALLEGICHKVCLIIGEINQDREFIKACSGRSIFWIKFIMNIMEKKSNIAILHYINY